MKKARKLTVTHGICFKVEGNCYGQGFKIFLDYKYIKNIIKYLKSDKQNYEIKSTSGVEVKYKFGKILADTNTYFDRVYFTIEFHDNPLHPANLSQDYKIKKLIKILEEKE